jgi:crotonobetainyl-CoA:carnitine CoA-transferase CaiB-like acyl-CoA transferase
LLGEHSVEVLGELGYDRDDIRALSAAGVIREPR